MGCCVVGIVERFDTNCRVDAFAEDLDLECRSGSAVGGSYVTQRDAAIEREAPSAGGHDPYSLAIAAMACMAMWLPWAGWPAMLGVVSFVVSDGVLSAELFKLASDAPARRITAPIVWWSYAGAQALIVWGIVRAAEVMQ